MNSSHPSPPGCENDLWLNEKLRQHSPFVQGFLIFIVIINILSFPFTAVLNALVMIAVKTKPRLRAHKSNILLATLALTDFAVGILVQPVFIALVIMFLLEEPSGYCLLRFFRPLISGLTEASLFRLVLISGERYLAMKHPFAYSTLVTEARLLVASALVWFLSVILQVRYLSNLKTAVMGIKHISIGLSIAFIVFCHVIVYRKTRRHEQQLAAQQISQQAREQFKNNKRAFKVTSIVITVLVFCYLPLTVCSVVASYYRSEFKTPEAVYICLIFAVWIILSSSLINPIIYSIRMRQFRVAFIELICRTVNVAEAEEIEMRLFGAPNAAVRLEAGQELEQQDQQNVEQANVNDNVYDNHNDNVLPQSETYVVEQPNNNSHCYCVHYRHSI